MKPIRINAKATVTEGLFKGITGNVVGADSRKNEVELKVDSKNYITVSRDSVKEDSHE